MTRAEPVSVFARGDSERNLVKMVQAGWYSYTTSKCIVIGVAAVLSISLLGISLYWSMNISDAHN